MHRDLIDAGAIETWLRSFGAWAPAGFVLLYAAGTVLFFSGALLSLTGGALFGPVWGTVWNLLGATLGATLAFLIARGLGADWVARRLGGRLQRLVDGVAEEGWRFVALMRLVPLVPFNLLNYALGLVPSPPSGSDANATRHLRDPVNTEYIQCFNAWIVAAIRPTRQRTRSPSMKRLTTRNGNVRLC